MKNIILVLFILAAGAIAQAPQQPYTGTTTPATTDDAVRLLMKIDKILNDSKTGASPLLTASAGTGSTVAPVNTAGTLTTTATIALPVNASRRTSLFNNFDASIVVYVGAAGVTSATGFPVQPGQSYVHTTTAALYAVAASGTPAYRTITEQ